MENLIKDFEEITKTRNRPWLKTNNLADAKYRELLIDTPEIHIAFAASNQVYFPKPTNPRRTYYFWLIHNAAVNFLNTIYSHVVASEIETEKSYWVNHHAMNAIERLLIKVNSINQEKGFTWDAFEGPARGSAEEVFNRDNAFIMQLLKYHLLWIAIEIQDTFPDIISIEPHSLDELHNVYFQDTYKPEIVNDATHEGKPVRTKVTVIGKQITDFEVKAYDFREGNNKIVSYSNIVFSENKFSTLEKLLFELHLIDKDTNFIALRPNNQTLAAIIATAYNKSYFKPKYLIEGKGTKKISRRDVSRFIEYRYGCSIDQQYRTYLNEDNGELKLFTINNPVLKQI